jgi:hypothetical protein
MRLVAVRCCPGAANTLFYTAMAIRGLIGLLAVTLLLCEGTIQAQSDKECDLRYEAFHYATIASVIQHHVVSEHLSARELAVSIYAYRLDRKIENGAGLDSVSLGTSHLNFENLGHDSISAMRERLLRSSAAKAVQSYELKYLGRVDTIAGLPSYQYAVMTNQTRELLVWLASAPPGLDSLILWQSLEYSRRNMSFLLEEEFCNMIRLVLLRGVDFPPDSSAARGSCIITRYDSAVNTDYFTVRDNTYLFELKGVTVKSGTGK